MKKNLYVIENALLNIGKNKGRNILLGVMIFAIITTTVVAMAIYNTSGALISDYKQRFGSEVSISPEKQMVGGNNSLEVITAEQTLAFSQSEYLQSTDMSSSLACRSDTLTALDSTPTPTIAATAPFASTAGGSLRRTVSGSGIAPSLASGRTAERVVHRRTGMGLVVLPHPHQGQFVYKRSANNGAQGWDKRNEGDILP
jgi:hypothetical protein